MLIEISRRGVIGAGAALLASTALPRLAGAAGPKRLVVAADSEPRQLNPAIVASNGVFFISSKIIEPLAEASYEGDGLRPLLATAWKGSEDGRTITFTLREGVTWHDGTPFTSADVAFSAMEVWKPLQNIGRGVFANLEAVDTPDDVTAVFRFSKPTPEQLIANALPVVSSVLPKHLYRGHRHRGEPGQRGAGRDRALHLGRVPAGRILSAEEEPRLLERGAAAPRRARVPRPPRPGGGGELARGGRDPARRLLGGAAGRPRQDRAGRRGSRSSPRATRR